MTFFTENLHPVYSPQHHERPEYIKPKKHKLTSVFKIKAMKEKIGAR